MNRTMFDLHVHGAPDVGPRWGSDIDIANAYVRAGFSGCVFKGHYESTVGRAALVAQAFGELRVYGGIALNQHVGGFNPAAVASALAEGARVVWMPTADAHTQRTAGLPRLCGQRPELSEETYAAPPVDPSTEEPIRLILAQIADADAVLATGHLSGSEVRWLVAAARSAGVRRILLTHPSYTVPDMAAAEVAELADTGVHVEVTSYQLRHQPGMTAAKLAEFCAAIPIERLVLSSDAGQVDSPPPPDALAELVDVLAAAGLDRAGLVAAAGEIPERLVAP